MIHLTNNCSNNCSNNCLNIFTNNCSNNRKHHLNYHIIQNIFEFIVISDKSKYSLLHLVDLQDMNKVILNKWFKKRYAILINHRNLFKYYSHKYNRYHHLLEPYLDYEYNPWIVSREQLYISPLYDALCTGMNLPFACSSYKKINLEILQDIERMLVEFPGMVLFSEGTLRGRSDVGPLYIAFINHNIPLNIVQKVLALHQEYSAHNNIRVHTFTSKIVDDLRIQMEYSRQKELMSLMNKL